MFGIGTTELILILVVMMILFGVGKLPEIGSGLGKTLRDFKKATSEDGIAGLVSEEKTQEKKS